MGTWGTACSGLGKQILWIYEHLLRAVKIDSLDVTDLRLVYGLEMSLRVGLGYTPGVPMSGLLSWNTGYHLLLRVEE